MTVKGKVVVIAGASSGIGAATAKKLAAHGAKLFIGARREDLLKQQVEEITADGGEAAYKTVDVTDKNSVADFVKAAHDKYGKIDVMYNNAGVMPNSALRDLKVEDWEQAFQINVMGVLYGIAAALPIMKEQGFGHFIATDSNAGHVINPNAAIYSGTKFALRAIMDALRQEEGPNMIRSTIVSPGNVNTSLWKTVGDPELQKKARAREEEIGLDPEDLANAVLYAIDQPENVGIDEILLRPTVQEN
ncbi:MULTISPECIES: SDR family oxidoreductase [Furfurilactobacillus]|uniref:SDR family NAD(P)-dependent oxidoreductase n=1 Tax=Furfurilactobacillus rossiae TaxID=231049 RepID=A0A7C9IXN4_9LACO|nr:SDR family oxidoreductase [Furfurilactobacillus milii]MYV04675.1 SDR family NAD(P)-dependent oxidoreductase [Furfurilactobacillus milii]